MHVYIYRERLLSQHGQIIAEQVVGVYASFESAVATAKNDVRPTRIRFSESLDFPGELWTTQPFQIYGSRTQLVVTKDEVIDDEEVAPYNGAREETNPILLGETTAKTEIGMSVDYLRSALSALADEHEANFKHFVSQAHGHVSIVKDAAERW